MEETNVKEKDIKKFVLKKLGFLRKNDFFKKKISLRKSILKTSQGKVLSQG